MDGVDSPNGIEVSKSLEDLGEVPALLRLSEPRRPTPTVGTLASCLSA
jgi:hypothetical protein